MCCWKEKPRLRRVSKRHQLTAYKYLTEYVANGELTYMSPTHYGEWPDFRCSGHVHFWLSDIRGGVYCYAKEDANHTSVYGRHVKLKIWGKIHEHHEEFMAPAGYRASYAEIEAVEVDGTWVPVHEYAAILKEEHEMRIFEEERRHMERLMELEAIDREIARRKKEDANDRARAIALPPSPLPKEAARGDEHANDVTVANSPG